MTGKCALCERIDQRIFPVPLKIILEQAPPIGELCLRCLDYAVQTREMLRLIGML